jgi:2,5-diamino-6-(ribosylamino)-4(3H)-pyrimidinone 5'-phosphate reductase
MTIDRRPYIICHMGPSIDGRITGVSGAASLTAAYERTAKMFDADGWIIGRVSMEPYAGKSRIPRSRIRIPRKDFVANVNAKSYAIAIDPSGKLTWKSNAIDDERVITILTERVSDHYLAFLRSKEVSYLFGGKSEINLKRVLAKLTSRFGIKTLLLEGGGKINGSFLAADAIDELSILIAPVAVGAVGTPTLFDVGPASARHKLRLISVKRLEDDIVWLRYKVRPVRR